MDEGDPTKTILLVDDNEDDVFFTRRALIALQISTNLVVVGDGVEALDWLFLRGAHANRDPSLAANVVLLDLRLPRIDGIGVLEAMRAHADTRDVRVVVLTSLLEDELRLESYGVSRYVRKSIWFEEFVQQLSLGLD